MRERLLADQDVVREAAAIVRAAPSTTRWAVLSEPAPAEQLASLLDAMAERLEVMDQQLRTHIVRVAAEPSWSGVGGSAHAPTYPTPLIGRAQRSAGLLDDVDDRPVALAVVTSELGVLVGRRIDEVPPWVFVGGKVEPGEGPADAAVREAREEAGVAVTARAEIVRRVHPRTGRLLIYVDCMTDNPVAAMVNSRGELDEVRWVGVEALRELMPDLFSPVQKRLRGGA